MTADDILEIALRRRAKFLRKHNEERSSGQTNRGDYWIVEEYNALLAEIEALKPRHAARLAQSDATNESASNDEASRAADEQKLGDQGQSGG